MRFEGEAGCLEQVALGHDRLGEPELRRFTEASLEARDRAHLPGESHLTNDDDVATPRTIHVTRRRCDEGSEIGCRLHDPSATCDVDEDVLAGQGHSGALL